MRCARCHVAWMGEGQLAYYSRVTASGVSMMSVIPLPWCKHGTQGSIALSGKRSIWNSEESGPQSSRPKPRGLSDQARPARKAGGTKRARSDLPCRRTGLQHADTLRARPLMEALVRSNHSRSNPGSTDNRQYRAVPCPTPSGALTNHKTQHGIAAARQPAAVCGVSDDKGPLDVSNAETAMIITSGDSQTRPCPSQQSGMHPAASALGQ
jgi:hypothetical protein